MAVRRELLYHNFERVIAHDFKAASLTQPRYLDIIDALLQQPGPYIESNYPLLVFGKRLQRPAFPDRSI